MIENEPWFLKASRAQHGTPPPEAPWEKLVGEVLVDPERYELRLGAGKATLIDHGAQAIQKAEGK